MNRDKSIIFFHLFNNYSGSPKVLRQIIEYFVGEGFSIVLITNRTEGFLSNIPNIKYNYVNYKWSENKLITLIYFVFAQIQIFIKTLYYINSNATFYINTITPIGALWGSKIIRKKTICHVHENYINKNIVNRICEFSFELTSPKAIFVSQYLKDKYSNHKNESIVVYNYLEKEFIKRAVYFTKNQSQIKDNIILMVCSNRKFKGIFEFAELSKLLPNYQFELVLSTTIEEVDKFKKDAQYTSNLTVFSNQTNLHPFYERAKILLNLSQPDSWVETFGLTILEAMQYSIPTIVPNIGGPTELVIDKYNGFLVDTRDIETIKDKILLLSSDSVYEEFSKNSLAMANNFIEINQINKIRKVIE